MDVDVTIMIDILEEKGVSTENMDVDESEELRKYVNIALAGK